MDGDINWVTAKCMTAGAFEGDARERFSKPVGHLISAFNVSEAKLEIQYEGAEGNDFSIPVARALLICRVERYLDERLIILVQYGRRVHRKAKVQQQLAEMHHLASGVESSVAFCLCGRGGKYALSARTGTHDGASQEESPAGR